MRALALALLLLVAAPRLAEAHATLLRSTPASGAVLKVAPREIVLVFSEELESKLARVSIVSSSGRVFTVTAHPDPHDVNALIGEVEGLPEGGYWLEWRVVSADGHPVEGRFHFAVGRDVPASRPQSQAGAAGADAQIPEPHNAFPVLASALRGLGIGLLMALAGLLGFRRNADSSMTEESRRRSERTASWLSAGAALLCAGHLAAWLINVSPTHSLDGSSVGAILGSNVGRLELWRTGLAIMAAWALLLARRHTLALLFAGAALLVSGATGHSAAIAPLLATPSKAAHLVAGAVWLGGLVWLLTLSSGDASILREGRRVSGSALVAVVLVAQSGIVQAWLFLPSPMDLVRTTYGALVIAKSVGLLVLVAFGAQHRFKSLPALEQDPATARLFHASLTREVVVMTIVVLLGGVLAYISPTQ